MPKVGREYRNCLFCNKIFRIYPYRIKIGENKYCSFQCYKISIKGIKKSEELKEQISKTLRGRFLGKNNHNWKHGLSNSKNYIAIRNKIRRSLERGGGKLNIKTVQAVYEDNIKKYGTLTCYLCKLPIEFGSDTLEHSIPLYRGGTNDYENLAIACRVCNCKKGKKTLEEYGVKNA